MHISPSVLVGEFHGLVPIFPFLDLLAEFVNGPF